MKNPQYIFGVITRVPSNTSGNYACDEIMINPDADNHLAGANIIVSPPFFDEELFAAALSVRDQTTIDLTKRQMIFCNTPVFELGEIMIIDPINDRTIPDGRKPLKWDVKCEYFNSVDSAVARSKEVTENRKGE